MPTALRDAQPWRRALAEHGLTYAWLAERTAKSPATVQAYAVGDRNPPAEWIEKADAVIAEHVKATAA